MSVLYSLSYQDMPMTLTASGTISFGKETKRYIRACDALCGEESRAARLLRGGPSVRRTVEALLRATTPDWFDEFTLWLSHAGIEKNWSASIRLTDRHVLQLMLPPRWYARIYQTGRALSEGSFVIDEDERERYTLGWRKNWDGYWHPTPHWTNLRPRT